MHKLDACELGGMALKGVSGDDIHDDVQAFG